MYVFMNFYIYTCTYPHTYIYAYMSRYICVHPHMHCASCESHEGAHWKRESVVGTCRDPFQARTYHSIGAQVLGVDLTAASLSLCLSPSAMFFVYASGLPCVQYRVERASGKTKEDREDKIH